MDIKQLNYHPFSKFDDDWALATAGNKDGFNTLTISWGSMGTIWNKSVITIYARPDRYTSQFLKENDIFTVSFFPEEYRQQLVYLGTHSGRDIDKVKEVNFHPLFLKEGVTFKEASEIFVCKKICMQQFDYD